MNIDRYNMSDLDRRFVLKYFIAITLRNLLVFWIPKFKLIYDIAIFV